MSKLFRSCVLVIFFGLESEFFTLGTATGRRETWLGAVKKCVGSYVPFLVNPFDDSARSSGTDSSPGSPMAQGSKNSQMRSEFLPKDTGSSLTKLKVNDAAENAARTRVDPKLNMRTKNNNVFAKCIKCNFSPSNGLIEIDNSKFSNMSLISPKPGIHNNRNFSKQSIYDADSNKEIYRGGDFDNGDDSKIIAETEIAIERRDMDEKKIAQEIYSKFLNTNNTNTTPDIRDITDITTLYPYLLPYIRAFWKPVEPGETSADEAFPSFWTLVDIADEDATSRGNSQILERSALGKKEKTSIIALVCDLGKFEMMYMQDRSAAMTSPGSSASKPYFHPRSKEVKKVFDSSSRRAAELKEFVDVVVDELNEIFTAKTTNNSSDEKKEEEHKNTKLPGIGLQYPTLHTILSLDGLNLENLDHNSPVNPRITKAQDLSSALLDIIVALKRVIPLTGGLIADPLDPKFASELWQAARILGRLDAGLTKVNELAADSGEEKKSASDSGGIIMYPKIRGMDFGYYGGTSEKKKQQNTLGSALETEDATKGPQLPQRERTRAINYSAKILSPSNTQRRLDDKLQTQKGKVIQTQQTKVIYIHSVYNFDEGKEIRGSQKMRVKEFANHLVEIRKTARKEGMSNSELLSGGSNELYIHLLPEVQTLWNVYANEGEWFGVIKMLGCSFISTDVEKTLVLTDTTQKTTQKSQSLETVKKSQSLETVKKSQTEKTESKIQKLKTKELTLLSDFTKFDLKGAEEYQEMNRQQLTRVRRLHLLKTSEVAKFIESIALEYHRAIYFSISQNSSDYSSDSSFSMGGGDSLNFISITNDQKKDGKTIEIECGVQKSAGCASSESADQKSMQKMTIEFEYKDPTAPCQNSSYLHQHQTTSSSEKNDKKTNTKQKIRIDWPRYCALSNFKRLDGQPLDVQSFLWNQAAPAQDISEPIFRAILLPDAFKKIMEDGKGSVEKLMEEGNSSVEKLIMEEGTTNTSVKSSTRTRPITKSLMKRFVKQKEREQKETSFMMPISPKEMYFFGVHKRLLGWVKWWITIFVGKIVGDLFEVEADISWDRGENCRARSF